MPNIKISRALKMVQQGVTNLVKNRPFAISLEITHSCNCNCKHCDKGGWIKNEKLAPPERFGDLIRELKPLVAQISGGEPFLRKDVYEIVSQIKGKGDLPYLVFVSNAALLNEQKYLELKELGIDEFSISLDFPDERHDKNRGLPGLYKHLSQLLPKLAAYGNNDITLISVIRRESLPELRKLAEHSIQWNVSINFSAYSPLRTNDFSLSINGKNELDMLRKEIDYLIKFKQETGRIFTTVSVLQRYYDFFANGSNLPGCRAGYRSMVINPDGRLAPCAMQPFSFETREDLINNFSKKNTCGGCLVSLRANTEKTIATQIKDGWLSLKQIRNNN
jgi:MoaA/NifB/PqqE/SkfB family radical SAM enzyme